jgi:ABC-type sugar transport system, periplasmic component
MKIPVTAWGLRAGEQFWPRDQLSLTFCQSGHNLAGRTDFPEWCTSEIDPDDASAPRSSILGWLDSTTRSDMKVRAGFTWLCVLVAGAAVLAACSSSGNSSAASSTAAGASGVSGAAAGSSVSSGAPSSGGSGADAVAKWEAGTEGSLPSSGPKPKAGTNVWVISCGQAAQGCATPSNAMIDAGTKLGWKMHLFDGQLNPVIWGQGIKNALAGGAQGIITYGMDCPLIKAGLQAAAAAKVPVFGDEGFDCNTPGTGGGQALFSATMKYTPAYPDLESIREANGAAQADWILANAGPKANVIEFKNPQILTNAAVNTGFEAEIKKVCPGCSLHTVSYTLADLSNGQLKIKAQSALVQDPDADAVESPTDSDMALVIGPVLDASPDRAKMHIIAGEGYPQNITQALSGHWEDAGIGNAAVWEGWASVDGMNRLLNGAPQVFSGFGFRLWQAKPPVNLPPSGQAYQPKADFQANYLKIWQAGS